MAATNCEVSIAAHYVPERVPFLVQALEAIGQWQEHSASVTIVTNDMALAEEAEIARVVAELETRGHSARFDRTHGLAHPFHLTWWHKAHLREWFERDGPADDLFLYIEDDIAVTEANLHYFRRFLPAAKQAGCIPGLLCYEIAPWDERYSTGFRGPQIVREGECLALEGQRFVSPAFPYWPGFILDRELCAQYLASPWSDIEQAERMPQSARHTCRVQSAWALTYDNVPKGLHSRYVLPVDARLNPLPESCVLHTAGNYSVTRRYSFGTVRLRDVFLPMGITSSLRQGWWNARALMRRIADKLRRTFSSAG
ncbi:hypothetical protein [Altererythrobacter sp.]|uniref:hypothetical protein n=1 Tax=Altererythrobacter sp. TaxID=1872480 RepID=UPI003CFBC565